MFSDLKAQLVSVETRLRALIGTMQAEITGLEGDIQTIDKSLLGAFDRVSELVRRTRAQVTTRCGAVKREIEKLVPPP